MIHPLPSTCSARGRLAFRAVALRAARSRCPSIQKCSELKPPEHLGTANIRPFRQFRRDRPFLYFPLGLLGECAPFATLAADMGGRRRRVSPVTQADTCCNTRKKSAFL